MPHLTASLELAIRRLNTGDESARDELMALLVRRLEVCCQRLLRRDRLRFHLRIDDLLQESLFSLYMALKSTHVGTAHDLLRLGATHVRRRACDLARRLFGACGAGRNEVNASDLPDAGLGLEHRFGSSEEDPQHAVQARERDSVIHQEIARLPRKLRELIQLCWFERHTCREAADILDICEKTARKRLLAAQGRLERLLRQRGFDVA